MAHEDKQRDRIAELSATPTGEHWDAIIAAAANTPDAAKLINVITADYLRMRTERDEWAGIAGSNAGETELVKRNLEDAEGRYDACYAELTKTQAELAALRLRLEEAERLMCALLSAPTGESVVPILTEIAGFYDKRRAYEVYCHVFRPQEALVTSWCRGGFSVGELVGFLYAHSFPKEEWDARFHEALKGMKL